MKFPNVDTKTLVIICAAGILGFLFWNSLSGLILQPAGSPENESLHANILTEPLPKTDASFTIGEVNISEVGFIPIIHVTYDDFEVYPRLEQAMHSDNNNTRKWFAGSRMVVTFEGNLSSYKAFVDKVCKDRPLTECNMGVLFEYHGDYYKVSLQEYGTMPRNPN